MAEEPRLATVLNVNDDEANRYLVNRVLKMSGYHVLEAATGMAAILLAEQHRPDVIVLDVKLPDISGYEVCARLRANAATASIAVMHTSATFVTPDKKVQGLEGGADAYLTQPYEPSELVATVRSLLRLRHAEQQARLRTDQLIEMDRRKDEFLAMLGHELRNPLAAIMTAIGILERRGSTDDKEARMHGIIHRQTHHLARLVDDLLDVSRITRGKVELRQEPVNLTDSFQQVLSILRHRVEERGLKLEAHLPSAPLWLQGDATRLEQIFTNLLDNAAKYTDQGTITVELFQEGVDGSAQAVLRVKDTGIGIPPEKLPAMFDLFAQADTSLERSRGGLGIGLTLVRTLARMHGGTVEATSGGLGQGSEFVVKLPLLREDRLAQPDGVEDADARRARRILLMEGHPDARQSLRDMLELWGHQVTVAPDGARGVAMALEQSPELVLVELGLPGLDGYQVARALRTRMGQDLRLVALSGDGDADDYLRALKAGFDLHLTRPVRPTDLERVLSDL